MKKILIFLGLLSLPICFVTAQSWNIPGNSNADNNSKLGTTNNIPLRLFTNNNEQMRIDGKGQVGIGTTSLNNARLNVDGTVDHTLAIFGNSVHGISLVNDFPTIGFNSYYKGGWKTLNKGYSGLIAVNNFTGDMQFSTGPFTNKNVSIVPEVRMNITQDGNVGIGTTTPGFPLNFPDKAGDKISLFGNTGAHYGFGIQDFLLQIHTDIPSSDIAFGYGSSASFTERMRIKGNGNVGIGTATPAYKLDVCGTIRSKEVVVQTGWCDYVFDRDYTLRPLSEVEAFIQQNRHLPDIPSAADVENNGLKVADMSARMMKKIEELTLYVVQQNKQIEQLQQKVKQLKNNDDGRQNQ